MDDSITYTMWQANGPGVACDLDALARASTIDDLPRHLRTRVEEAGAEDDLREACDLVAETIRSVARGDWANDVGEPTFDVLDLG